MFKVDTIKPVKSIKKPVPVKINKNRINLHCSIMGSSEITPKTTHIDNKQFVSAVEQTNDRNEEVLFEVY